MVRALCYGLRVDAAWRLVAAMQDDRDLLSPSVLTAVGMASAVIGDLASAQKAVAAAEALLAQMPTETSRAGIGSALLANRREDATAKSLMSGGHQAGSKRKRTAGHTAASAHLFERNVLQEAKHDCERILAFIKQRQRAAIKQLKEGCVSRFGSFFQSTRVRFLPGTNAQGSFEQNSLVAGTKIDFDIVFSDRTPLPGHSTARKSADAAAAVLLELESARVAEEVKERVPVRVEVCSGHGDWIVEKADIDRRSNWVLGRAPFCGCIVHSLWQLGDVIQVGMEIRPDRVFQTWSKATFKSLDNLLLVVCAAAGHRTLRLSAQSNCLRVVLV